MKLIVCLLALAIAMAAAQIPPAPIKTVWEDMYPPPYNQLPQICIDFDCISSSNCMIAGGSNGIGFGVYKYDGKMNGQVQKMMEPNMSMMVMSITVGGTDANPRGAFSGVVDFTIGKGLQYLAKKGTEWLPSIMPLEIVWASQSISSTDDAMHVVAVGNGFTDNLMVSHDAGVIFAQQALKYKDATHPNCSYPGNIAMPSDNVWFLTWGNEPPQNNSNAKHYNPKTEVLVGSKANGQVLYFKHRQTGKVRTHVKTPLELRQDRLAAQAEDKRCNFYYGSILKSTDQGASWTKVYTNPTFNFAQIECFSTTECTSVGFNADEAVVAVTKDGGSSWKVTLRTPMPSQTEAQTIGAVGYASKTELWAAGSDQTRTGGSGMFWSSTDAGETWTKYPHTMPNIMVIMSMEFTSDGVGFAIGLSEFKTSTILRYKKQPDYGYFIQSHCPFKGCTFMCQNISFPQGMCLGTQGGSAKAVCQDGGVKQYVYQTTSCVGSYTTHMQPVGQCLNATDGSFFENYCPSSVKEEPRLPAGLEVQKEFKVKVLKK